MVHQGNNIYLAVLCMAACCSGVPINELLDRASQRSDRLHSLSTSLTHQLDSHLPPIGRMIMPRPSLCHTSSLQTPNDKEQALQVSESELLSLARSLLQAWMDPLVVLSDSANALPQQAHNAISSKIRELQEDTKTLGDGLDILSGKMGPLAQMISFLPFGGNNDLGPDRMSRLVNFHFLLSCLRRDSHKIDTLLKVLHCRTATTEPNVC
ncbi:prolactin [Genypterus blacodes]|uniref:prolactin n=1 Tax=Genypterus blacodes TaxID=154954 RepID=UPI003F75A10F